MTIGQRIAQRRKELGLSQEALGEQLGVSRQSIYKWESDTALPDIDKLIALSRLFGVTVGWLLGVEEDAPGADGPAPETSGDLTEAQLKMVEEIVERYLAAQPKVKKRWWPWALAAVVLFFTLFNLYDQLDVLQMQNESIHDNISRVERSVDNQINSISNRVEEILKSQNDLTADYGAEITRANLESGSVTFSMYAVPKTYVEGMSAKFSVDNGNGSNLQEVPEAVNQKFSADITCELTDTITLSVVFIYPDGTSQTQLLSSFYDLYSNSLPGVDLMSYDNLIGLEPDGGMVSLPETYLTTGGSSSAPAANAVIGIAEIEQIRVGLFLNKTLVAWGTPCEQPKNFHGSFSGRTFYCVPQTAVRISGDDELCFAVVVTDEYGREGVYMDIPYILRDGELTWPDSADLSDHDPSHWTY